MESALIFGRGGFCPPSVDREKRIEEDRPSSSPRVGLISSLRLGDSVLDCSPRPSRNGLPFFLEVPQVMTNVPILLLHTSWCAVDGGWEVRS